MGDVFKLETLENNIGLLTYDIPGKKVNTLGQPVIEELTKVIADLEKKNLRGLLLKSGKPGQFVAGADLNELLALAYIPKEQFIKSAGHVHGLFTRLSRLPYPTVALIEGASMGGGTELALSFDYRICGNDAKTQIGLPEVKVGIIPGWGGTQRLPRLIGLQPAIEMITSGEPVKPAKAVSIGLVFDAVPPDKLVSEGVRLIELANKTGTWKEERKKREQPLGLSPDEMFFMFAGAEGLIRQKTKGQYPAPLVAVRVLRDSVNLPLEEGLKVEVEGFTELAGTPISANLIAVFFMDTRVRGDSGVADRNVKPREIGKVGVLGAGLMGGGIATAAARSNIRAAMVDVDDAALAKGVGRARDVVAGRMKAGRATADDLANMLSNMSTSTSTTLFQDCDLVIEAIVEKEDVKKDTYKKLASVLKPGAILASNTSTISITRLAQAAPDPALFAGMHFFNPVDRMQLVEVIRGEKTSDETVVTLVALAKKLKKTPIVCKDCPGFVVNRLLLPYMNEALVVLLEGAPMDQIDKVVTKFGMPMGPIALQDLVGLDTSLYAGNVVIEAFKDRAANPGSLLADLVKAGRLGQKTGSGFRKFTGKKGKPEPDPEFSAFLEKSRLGSKKFEDAEIIDRLFLPMLVEATRILEEGIVRDPSDIDLGMILGTGFPPFRGGILRYCDQEGAGKIIERLGKYTSLGKRFAPTEMLEKMAKSGDLFYPKPKGIG